MLVGSGVRAGAVDASPAGAPDVELEAAGTPGLVVTGELRSSVAAGAGGLVGTGVLVDAGWTVAIGMRICWPSLIRLALLIWL